VRLGHIATPAAQAALCALVLVAAAGAADPSYAPTGPLPAGPTPATFALADLDDDGHLDLAVANRAANRLTVLLGDGEGGFAVAPGAPVPAGDVPHGVAAADLDDDGAVDLAVANRGTTNRVTVLLGDGAGGFAPAPGSPVAVGGEQWHGREANIVTGDFDGDGSVDLIVPVRQATWRVAILLGDGAGRFTAAPASPVAVEGRSGSTQVAVADLNGDEHEDLAVANSESPLLSILLGDGAGRFGAPIGVAAGHGPSALAVGDVNGDERLDLAVASLYSASGRWQPKLTIMLGNGRGGFRRAAGSPIGVPGIPASVALADLDGDRRLDVAEVSRGWDEAAVTVLRGTGGGRFRQALDSPFPPVPLRLATQVGVADLNGDERPDLAVGSDKSFTILLRTPSAPAMVQGRRLRGRPNPVFATRGPITLLTADGNRAAAKTASTRGCGRVELWTAPGRTSRSLSTPVCGSILCARGSGCVDELAIGAGQVAWISRSGGNNLELTVVAAKLTGGAPRKVDYATNGAGAGGDPDGEWIANLRGGGSVLAYERWRFVCDREGGFGCETDDPMMRVTEELLVRLSAGRRVVVKRGPGSRPLRAAAGGRLAVESGGAITILAASGTRVATIPAAPADPPRALALSASRLVVSRTFTLDVYGPSTGARVKSIPLGPAAALRVSGVNSSLALLRGPRRVVLVRLRDGKLIALPLTATRAASIVDARLTEAGLFYAYNVTKPRPGGRITFETTARLLSRF
jgi:hypothetical protein